MSSLIVVQNAIPRSFVLPIDLVGVGTAWLGLNPVTLFTTQGDASISSVIVANGQQATAILTTGQSIGPITITDTSTGAAATVTVFRPANNPNPGQRELRSGWSRQRRRVFGPIEQLGYSDFTN